VAEIAEKPLYRVTCGDLGTKATDVEKYMQTVLYLGKTWNCGKFQEHLLPRAKFLNYLSQSYFWMKRMCSLKKEQLVMLISNATV